ncbi:hypothetical protein EHS39_31895 [Ensifer sp. MPMI2T]|nr:hypothetical protein EHS39_31895 [Ensifer sp. MPMI2T]
MYRRKDARLTKHVAADLLRQVNDPESVHSRTNRTGRVIVPKRPFERPLPHFPQWHREKCFKH